MNPRRFLLLIVVSFLGLGVLYGLTTPALETPDEVWHYAYVRQLAVHHELPVVDAEGKQPYRHEGLQPPLYYIIGSTLITWISERDLNQTPAPNPYARIGDPRAQSNDNRNAFLHPSDEGSIFQGANLAIHLLRLYSLLLGAGTVVLTYALAREVLPERPIIALGAAAFVAFLPQFIFISAAISNDNLATLLTVGTLWQLVRITRLGLTRTRIAVLGVLVGAALVTKLNTIALTPLVLIALAYVAKAKREWRSAIEGALIVAGIVALIAGWWYLRNLQLYGDLTTFSRLAGLVGERPRSLNFLRWFSAESEGLRLSLWGLFGWFNIMAAPPFYVLFDALAAVGLLGMVVALVRSRDLNIGLAILALWSVLIFFALWGYASIIITSQGRLLFPALPGWAILWCWGVSALIPSRARTWTMLGIGAAQAVVAALVPFLVIAPAYSPNIIPDNSLPKNVPALGWHFDNGVEWIGASVDNATLRPGDELYVTIYERVPAGPIDRNAVFLHLVNSAGAIIAQRDSYVASGSLGTLDAPITIADSYRILIPVTVPAPDEWNLGVGMYDPTSGQRADAIDSAGRALGNALTLSTLKAQPATVGLLFDFDGHAMLGGVTFNQNSIVRGHSLALTLDWLKGDSFTAGEHVFVHALGAEGDHIWASADVPLDSAGSMQIELAFDPQTPPAVYQLEVGVYIPPYGDRFAVFDSRGQDMGDRIFLGPIRVTDK
ncbi:MAG TPA: glycosyltransferase family 39 protein [Anaerolineae bacterium]